MTNGEKFCLKWNDFENNISSAFRELKDDKDFFDVTLACEDNQLQAHKVILSACSPFFRSVLKKNPHQHPLLYLKGVKYEDILSVLNFMYHGEVNVAQEDLNSFLAVAEDLKVKGLTQNDQKQQPTSQSMPAVKRSPPEQSPASSPMPMNARPSKQSRIRTSYEHAMASGRAPLAREMEDIPHIVKTEAPVVDVDCDPEPEPIPNQQLVQHSSDFPDDQSEYEYQPGYQEEQGMGFEDQVGQMAGDTSQGELDFDEFVCQNSSKVPGTKSIQCLLCSKVTLHVGNMKQHFEVHHYHRSYTCDVCMKNFKTKNCLAVHKKNQGHNSYI